MEYKLHLIFIGRRQAEICRFSLVRCKAKSEQIWDVVNNRSLEPIESGHIAYKHNSWYSCLVFLVLSANEELGRAPKLAPKALAYAEGCLLSPSIGFYRSMLATQQFVNPQIISQNASYTELICEPNNLQHLKIIHRCYSNVSTNVHKRICVTWSKIVIQQQ